MRKLILVFLSISLGLGLLGCNTMSGLGKDIERGGEKIQKAAH